LIIFGRDVAERVFYRKKDLLFHLSELMSLHYLGNTNPENWVASVMLYTENDTELVCYIFDISQSVSIIFGRS